MFTIGDCEDLLIAVDEAVKIIDGHPGTKIPSFQSVHGHICSYDDDGGFPIKNGCIACDLESVSGSLRCARKAIYEALKNARNYMHKDNAGMMAKEMNSMGVQMRGDGDE